MLRMRSLASVLMSFVLSSTCLAITSPQDPWSQYIDGTVGQPPCYLFSRAMSYPFDTHHELRALDLGSGAGNADIILVAQGWEVTGVDLSPRSGEVIQERAKNLKGHFQFQLSDFSSAQLTGNYDLVFSFSSLPFGSKKDLPNLIKNISQHMQSGAVFTANFFGYNHTYVKKGDTYGMSKEELFHELQSNHFKITYFLNNVYDRNDFEGNKVHWDFLDFVAVKL